MNIYLQLTKIMSKRLVLALLVVLSFGFIVSGKEVTLTDAEKAAKNFIYITLNKYADGIEMDQVRLSDPYVYKQNGQSIFYVFNLDPGFIIISAEDAFTPVIGYSFDGSFRFEDAIPNYRGFILNYADQINFTRKNQVEAEPSFAALWNELLTDNLQAAAITRDRDVEPLTRSQWDQGSPYNILCPEDPAGPGGHVWAGCVATAMAQIMYYWRYPETGTGEHCYTPNFTYGTQCANFGETYYGWDGMINSITYQYPFPNAELQYHCAVSVNMSFGPNGSGSYSYILPQRLNLYWRYNDAAYLERENFNLATWTNMLKDELDAGHPVYYSGYNPSDGGHAFVCEGYQGDNFYFNFGWGGSGDGYYSLSNVNGFYLDQAMVRYFVPSDDDYPYINTGNKTIIHKSGSITDGSGPIENYANNLDATWLIDPQSVEDSITDISISFLEIDLQAGDTLKVYDGGTTSDPLLAAFSGTSPPAELTSSSNKMLIRFITNSNGTGSGWYAEYSTTSPEFCENAFQLTEPSGTFDDGSGDFYYRNATACMWRIKPDNANKITLSFNSIDTEENRDKIKVYDNTTLIGEFSGSQVPAALEATSGTMVLLWTTDNINTMQGWEVSYESDQVGIQENSGISSLETYPNPAANELNILLEMDHPAPLTINLVNVAGQLVYQDNEQSNVQVYHSVINTSDLKPGIYFLKITSVTGSWNKKVVIAH